MPATAQEVETSMMETIERNEERVKEEKSKRRSCIDAMKHSLATLHEVLEEDLENSEETASASAEEVEGFGV